MEENLIKQLEETGNYKVIKRFSRQESYNSPSPKDVKSGIYLDSETTGLNAKSDKVIEIAMVPFEFDRSGNIYRILPEYNSLQDPGIPIPKEITRITGINNEMVSGQSIDFNKVAEMLSNVVLVIAHNAGFDRPFMEELFEGFRNISWACSIKDINWKEEGFESSKLEYLAYKYGFFFEGHRATIDCLAGIHLLSKTLPESGGLALNKLLETARKVEYRLEAANSPYDKKDELKRRGYKWNGEKRVWHIDIAEQKLDEELECLKTNIYNGHLPDLPKTKLTALTRYSSRI